MDKTKYDFLISLIPEGKENAISQAKLCELMGCKDTELRAIIQNARIDGIDICSIPGVTGYFFSDDEKEVAECYRMFEHRHKTTGEVLKTIGKHLSDIRKGERHV